MLNLCERKPDISSSNSYKKLVKIGEGTFGVVFKAVNSINNEVFALKEVKFNKTEEGLPFNALREVSLLRKLNHPNVTILRDAIITTSKLIMVIDFMDMNLLEYMHKRSNKLSMDEVQQFLYQILQGMFYSHQKMICHRDLKPQNILVNRSGSILKIADFGIGRLYGVPIKALTHHITTLWYRSPDLILGSQRYSTSLDIWSIGCVFAEMINGKALFKGDSEVDVLLQIFHVLGTPPNARADFTKMFHGTLPLWTENSLALYINRKSFCEIGLNLLKKFLEYDARYRINCQDALKHAYFHGFQRHLMPTYGAEYGDPVLSDMQQRIVD